MDLSRISIKELQLEIDRRTKSLKNEAARLINEQIQFLIEQGIPIADKDYDYELLRIEEDSDGDLVFVTGYTNEDEED